MPGLHLAMAKVNETDMWRPLEFRLTAQNGGGK